jgi:hypothetical protein
MFKSNVKVTRVSFWSTASAAAIVIATAIGLVPVRAETQDEKSCIIAAAQKLPNIPGLLIKSSSAKEFSKADLQRSGAQPTAADQRSYLVEIDVRAAAVDVTMSFVCAVGPRAVVAAPLGQPR